MDFNNLPSVDKFLRAQGIDVYYNTLGATDDLIRAYVHETHDIVDRAVGKTSHFVKHECYSLYYDFQPRQKFTGFENYSDLFLKTRLQAQQRFASVQFSPTLVVEKENNAPTVGYKAQLISFLSGLPDKEIVLYLSGGIDSEFLAHALIESGREFTTVIYRWKDSSGAVTNIHDIEYAYAFCQKHGLFPILKEIHIESLWESEEFLQIMQQSGIESSQLVTHIYMCMEMNNLISGAIHLFGGEVRYTTSFITDSGAPANLVQLGKVVPGFNGASYTENGPYSPPSAPSTSVTLVFNSSGSWTITRGGGIGTVWSRFPTNAPVTGTWAVAPLNPAGYEYRYRNVTSGLVGNASNPIPDSDAGWFSIFPGNNIIAEVVSDDTSAQGASSNTSFTLDIRPIGSTSFVSATMSIQASQDGI